MSVLIVLGASAFTVAATMGLAATWARRAGKVAVVDAVWGPGFAAVALVAALLATVLDEGVAWRTWVVAALVAAWGLRLGWHVRRRGAGQGEDPRYAALLEDGGSPLTKVFGPQGVAMWLVSLPVVVGSVSSAPWWPAVLAGAVVWAVGLAFEAVGDAQLAAYKARPREQRPPVMDQGLWAWTRHPNYFGDSVVWWGLWLAAGLASGPVVAVCTVVSPLAMTHLLRNVTGARLLERTMSRREGWEAYAARTPLFFPRPPRRS